MGEISLIGLIGVIGLIGAMMVGVVVDKGDGRGLWGQGCVFADFMRCCWLSEGCGRCRRPCPRLMHSEPSRLAVVTAFSLKLAATSAGVEGAAAVADSEHSEHSEGAALSVAASASTGGVEVGSEHSAGVGAGVALSVVDGGVVVVSVGVGAVSVGAVSVGGVAAARIWAR